MNTLKTASLAIAIALTALAAGCDTTRSTSRARGGDAVTTSGQEQAASYWKQNSSAGYMSRDRALDYRSPDGRAMEFSRIDTDGDSRISEREWKAYYGLH